MVSINGVLLHNAIIVFYYQNVIWMMKLNKGWKVMDFSPTGKTMYYTPIFWDKIVPAFSETFRHGQQTLESTKHVSMITI